MERVELAEAAALAGAVAAPLVLLARTGLAFAMGVLLLAAAEAGLAFALVPDQISAAVASPARVGASFAGLLVLGGLAALFVCIPACVPAVLLAAAAVRIPLTVSGEEAFLLVPLYGVLAAAALALLYRLARGAELRPLPLFLAAPTAAYVALAAGSLLWSHDPREGTIDLFFFLFPGALLVVVVAQEPLTAVVSRSLAAVLLASATAAAAVGIWQRWTHTLYFADDLEAENANSAFFRVSSIFNDPSVYGRYLGLGIVVLFVLLWLGRIRPAVGLPLLAVMSVGLYYSYSQTSFAALFVAILVVTLFLGDRRARIAVAATAGVVALAGAGLVVAAAQDDSVGRATSSRWDLGSRTLEVVRDHPAVGVGVGGQPSASTEVEGARQNERRNVSHTTPLTVAAELGVLGLAAYVAFLFGAARGTYLAARREPAVGLSLLGALVLLVAHSMAYAGFLEDPFVWLILGLTAARLGTARPAAAGTATEPA
jgi:hypothetical protein